MALQRNASIDGDATSVAFVGLKSQPLFQYTNIPIHEYTTLGVLKLKSAPLSFVHTLVDGVDVGVAEGAVGEFVARQAAFVAVLGLAGFELPGFLFESQNVWIGW